MNLRALFFGTPQLSADILSYLFSEGTDTIDIVGVVTNPDAVGGRGRELLSSPVATRAKESDIPLLQPAKVRNNSELITAIKTLNPDICLVVAYGKILPQELLDIPPIGFLNVHTSLLPRYRGAAPIQYALLNGETTTGLTVQKMSLGMDEGDILSQEIWGIDESDTTETLFAKTGEHGGPLLLATMRGLRDGTITPIPQDHHAATYTRYIEKKDGELQLEWTVDEAYHRWQAYTPWPGLFTDFNGIKIALLKIRKVKGERGKVKGEKFCIYENLPAIQLSDGIIVIQKIHPAGKKPMSGEEFVRGYLS